MIWLWILLGVLAVLIIWVIVAYNSFVNLRNQVKNSWAQIDVQLKRRCDLIPNLINSVKGYMKHERETLESVTQARTSIMNSQTPQESNKANNMLTDALKSIFAVAESYPDLKANQNFLQLQEELTGTENKVAASRQYYNDVVMEYNTKRETIPTNIIAGVFKFNEEELLEAEEKERANVKVEF